MRHIFSLMIFLLPVLAYAGEGQFESNGVRICYSETGNLQGEPVILVHGFVVTATLQWTIPGMTKTLSSSNYRVILFDNRGHGRSGRPKEDTKYGMEMVHDLARLMDHLQLKKAHLVGYSMGSFISHKFAVTYPDRVKSLVLGGAGWLREGQALEVMDEISESLRTKKSLEPLFRALHPIGALPITQEGIDQVNNLAMLINDPLALSAVAKGMKQLKMSEEEVKKVKAPTLCVVGDRDPLCESVKILEGQRPGLKTLYIKNAHHMDTFELPAFRDAVQSFLKEQQ